MENQQPAGRNISKYILIGLVIAVFLMVVVLLGMHYLGSEKTFYSKDFGYELTINTDELSYKRILLSGSNGGEDAYLERFSVVGTNDAYYLSVSRIDDATDLEEALEQFESDGSYAFTREEDASYGAEGYRAKRISYTDESETPTLFVSYYYDEVNHIVITVCTDEAHRKTLEGALSRIRITR